LRLNDKHACCLGLCHHLASVLCSFVSNDLPRMRDSGPSLKVSPDILSIFRTYRGKTAAVSYLLPNICGGYGTRFSAGDGPYEVLPSPLRPLLALLVEEQCCSNFSSFSPDRSIQWQPWSLHLPCYSRRRLLSTSTQQIHPSREMLKRFTRSQFKMFVGSLDIEILSKIRSTKLPMHTQFKSSHK
jgi:hypothetical protein